MNHIVQFAADTYFFSNFQLTSSNISLRYFYSTIALSIIICYHELIFSMQALSSARRSQAYLGSNIRRNENSFEKAIGDSIVGASTRRISF